MERYKIDVVTDNGTVVKREVIDGKDDANMKFIQTLGMTDVFGDLPYSVIFIGLYRFGDYEWELLRREVISL